MSNVFETPIDEMNKEQVNEALEQVTAWAEEHGWDASDGEGEPTAKETADKLLARLDKLA